MKRAQRGGTADAARRKRRPRTLPKWLQQSDLDAVARSRCLMVLSVLSGEKPVTDAILEAKVSRPTYYQLETRALNAMLAALNPLTSASDTGALELKAATSRITELQEQVQRLEREKRRTQRLLLLTRKSIRAPLTLGRRRGRPPKSAFPSSMPSLRMHSDRSRAKASTRATSTPTKAGEGAP
jgi:hypothetical protein